MPRSNWRRKALLLLPDFVTAEDVRAARETLSDKRGGDPLPRCVRLERIDEGASVQVLHVGPYAEEQDRPALACNDSTGVQMETPSDFLSSGSSTRVRFPIRRVIDSRHS